MIQALPADLAFGGTVRWPTDLNLSVEPSVALARLQRGHRSCHPSERSDRLPRQITVTRPFHVISILSGFIAAPDQ